ncbi:N-acetyltransferase [Streptomyces sp. NPDC051577]|uniref:N-acetyltransferase n=1 Tax=Streptomyces sp. NPDC051577 TaxID=3155166 RepID=UPI0034187176
MIENQRDFVPDAFDVPGGLTGDGFRLEPLGPAHNVRDLAAWSASIAHIRATPGFSGQGWPPIGGMTEAENLVDLERHAKDFADRRGFTYSVLEGADEVIGCVYLYPARQEHEHDRVPGRESVRVRLSSWVRADRAYLDAPLHRAVSQWLAEAWPFEPGRVDYAPR